ncbi:lipase family alpha/beta hydrolase [Thermosipho atlanticus]|uniref:PGAP1-like protein n=1 Tax=Thermosipho atlanticus DSM 15807 TaxID=1123380 RepID=A0A1M5SGY8_9BACT|nr:esterase [Thermosipho atlanticus]SHH37857.1 PGAP1-like protein [Thermosipho atlanticus DSM 15807]
MKKIFTYVFIIILFTYGFSIKLYEYKLNGITIYRSLGSPVDPFFDYDEVSIVNWPPFPAELITLREGTPTVIIIHGMSPSEIDTKIDYYKQSMINTFKEIFPDTVGLYFFLYPTLSEKLEKSAQKLIEYTQQFDSFYIYAHSMGGLVVQYAIQNEDFRKKIKKIIFAGTPHYGSPLANFMMIKKSIFKVSFGDKIELIKYALLISNILNASIEAPNYKYLIFGHKFPKIPSDLESYNFVGILDFDFKKEDLKKILTSYTPTLLGLMLLKYVIENIYPEESIFLLNDGMVPLYSATQDAKYTYIFHATNHADLAMRRDIIEKAMEVFGLERRNKDAQ